jgi:hypothetical protein
METPFEQGQISVEKTIPVSLWDWIITIFITMIPVLGQVMLFVWAFKSDVNPTKANWAKANLIWFGIALILFTLFATIFGIAAFSFMNS